MPDLTLRGAPAPSVYGLLHQGTFVLLATPQQAAADHQQYSDRLATVTCELADDRAEWAGLRALLIRPDGYAAWAAHESEPPADPPLRAWLS